MSSLHKFVKSLKTDHCKESSSISTDHCKEFEKDGPVLSYQVQGWQTADGMYNDLHKRLMYVGGSGDVKYFEDADAWQEGRNCRFF